MSGRYSCVRPLQDPKTGALLPVRIPGVGETWLEKLVF